MNKQLPRFLPFLNTPADFLIGGVTPNNARYGELLCGDIKFAS